MPSVLFVCTANRFRSVLSEAIFRHLMDISKVNKDWGVGSAGTWASDEFPPTKEAIEIANEMGLDISSHRSRRVTGQLISKYQLIIVMEQGQKEALINEFSEIEGRIFMLSEICFGMKYDIPDPYVTDELPKEIAEELNQLLIVGFEQILRLADNENTDF